jgi:hypothetical protein
MRRILGWTAWALLLAVAFGCGWGVAAESAFHTREDPAPADLVGTWSVPDDGYSRTVAEQTRGVPRIPTRLVLREDGSATIAGADLVNAASSWDAASGTPEERFEAAWRKLLPGEALPEQEATWRVVGDGDRARELKLTFPDRATSRFRLWGRSPPYRLFVAYDFADPDEGRNLFFEREPPGGR